jgi:hypothetical protein
MKEFFIILFFGKAVLLTPDPVSFVGVTHLSPDEPLVAVTSGASLQLDISNMIDAIGIKETGILESTTILEKRFPEDCVKAVLYGDGITVVLDERAFLLSNDGARLALYSKTGVPTKTKFRKTTVTSCSEVTDVKIYWKNFKH